MKNRTSRHMATVAAAVVVVGMVLLLPACKPVAPSGLSKTAESNCAIRWNDKSNNEDGFNIYIGGSCADCSAAKNWNKAASVAKNVTSFTWSQSCCSVAECACVMVRSFNAEGESGNSNVIVLSPVC